MLQTIAQKFNEGGDFMWIILFVLAAALAVSLERVIYYFISGRFNGRRLMAEVATALNKDNVKEAIEKVEVKKNPLHNLYLVALKSYDSGMDMKDIEEELEQASIMEVPKYAERLNYLSLFANIATLLGLLGTIAGLQTSFSSLATHEAAQKAAMLANGISQAMNTTAFGLIVAVPCMVLFTILSNKQKTIVRELDEAVVRLVSYIKKKKEAN